MNPQKKIIDPRFSHVFNDPRFKSMPKNSKKVPIDGRFKGVLQDPRFSTVPKFDQYGQKSSNKKNEFEEHYQEERSEEAEVEGKDKMILSKQMNPKIKKQKQEVVQEQEEEQDEVEDLEQEQLEQEEEEEEEEEEFDEDPESLENDSDDDSFGDIIDDGLPDGWEQEDDNAPNTEQATERLALQNYDWQYITAKDLMVLFSSFAPTGGSIKKVSVYQSEFGKKKMEEELINGPVEIFKKGFVINEDVYQRQQKKSSTQMAREINDLIVRGDQQDLDVDPRNLRKYEKDRLKYYYAVIHCDGVDTADTLYKSTLGQEFEDSNIKIDLRFVPDDLEFPNQPTQECDKLMNINGVKNIITRAIGHTNVKLTWDEPKQIVNFWHGKTEEELQKMDWSEYLGDCDAPLEEEEINKLIQQNENSERTHQVDWRSAFDKKKKSKNRDFDMEITFNTGFNDGGNAILEKEVKKTKKSRIAQNQDDDDFFIGSKDDEQAYEQKLTFKERKKELRDKVKSNKNYQVEKQRQAGELQLLVDKNTKKDQETFDSSDRRFQAIYENSQYAIDPTDKNFKQERAGKVFEEQIKRKKQKINQ